MVDRIPLFEEEIREEALERWYGEGLSRGINIRNYWDFFGAERFEYIYIWLEPRAGPLSRPSDFTRIINGYLHDLPEFRQPQYWEAKAREYENRDFPLGLMGWRGFMLPLFSREQEWDSLRDVLLALYDYPDLVKSALCAARDCFLETVRVASRYIEFDYGLIAEPIASRTGPVISPHMFSEFALPYYREIVDCFREHGIQVVLFRSFENVASIIPMVAASGVDGLWINQLYGVVDYLQVRKRHPNLLLLGGINARVLFHNEEAIRQEVQRIVPSLLRGGRYLPSLDDRPREDVPFRNYLFYRRLLQDVTTSENASDKTTQGDAI